jgi:hypothetical protein
MTKHRELTTPVIATPHSGFNMEIREGGHMSGAAMQHTIAFSDADAFARDAIVRTRHQCLGCGARRSLYRYRGLVKADANHTLCFRCYRALCDSMRARSLAQMASLFQLDVRKECR